VDTSLAVYTGGSLGVLDSVVCVPAFSGQAAPVESGAGLSPGGSLTTANRTGFEAKADQTYYIQVATASFFTFDVTGTVSIGYAPAGDANCSADLTALDALQVLRSVAGLPAANCVPNGDINATAQSTRSMRW
jgi:hypothetical protein